MSDTLLHIGCQRKGGLVFRQHVAHVPRQQLWDAKNSRWGRVIGRTLVKADPVWRYQERDRTTVRILDSVVLQFKGEDCVLISSRDARAESEDRPILAHCCVFFDEDEAKAYEAGPYSGMLPAWRSGGTSAVD